MVARGSSYLCTYDHPFYMVKIYMGTLLLVSDEKISLVGLWQLYHFSMKVLPHQSFVVAALITLYGGK